MICIFSTTWKDFPAGLFYDLFFTKHPPFDFPPSSFYQEGIEILFLYGPRTNALYALGMGNLSLEKIVGLLPFNVSVASPFPLSDHMTLPPMR